LFPQKFSFKKDELGNKRDTVELQLPKPTFDGILLHLKLKNKRNMLSTAYLQIKSFKRSCKLGMKHRLSTSKKIWISAKLTIDAIANLPPSERKGAGIAKEVWKQFAEDYIAIMPSLQGKSVENVTNAAKNLCCSHATLQDEQACTQSPEGLPESVFPQRPRFRKICKKSTPS